MVAGVQSRSFPTRAAAGFALAASILGSAVLGYSLNAPNVTPGPTRVIQVSGAQPATGGAPAASDYCLRQVKHAVC